MKWPIENSFSGFLYPVPKKSLPSGAAVSEVRYCEAPFWKVRLGFNGRARGAQRWCFFLSRSETFLFCVFVCFFGFVFFWFESKQESNKKNMISWMKVDEVFFFVFSNIERNPSSNTNHESNNKTTPSF